MLHPQNYRILVVDDNPDILFLLETVLTGEGYAVEVASNGRSALAKIATSRPDLVLLDVMMPGMDGYEVTQQLRQHPQLPAIPIILLTAYAEVDMVKGLDIGGDIFLRKPLDEAVLLARIRALLRFQDRIEGRK
ncbi:response regulator transcription factor [Mastigocladopsis repens]|uniref:response regulator transcription factor n=1 Tax=Mastigocladopsis repens TaxID=221287 RepID=UPI0005272195|nr:response regulator [Mastigocladopsis repens]